MKVLTVVGTRPEVIRLSRTIALLDASVEHILVHTGQNAHASLNDVFFSDMGIRPPDFSIGAGVASEGQFLAEAFLGVERILDSVQPDAFLLLGDTNSALTAILAKKRRIPVYHLEAGNRSFDPNVPEETNRCIVDHLADFNFPYSEQARRNLAAEGLAPRRIILSGSPLPEILAFYSSQIDASDVVRRLGLEKGNFFIVSAHRQENVDSVVRLRSLLAVLEAVHERYGLPILVSTHPRTAHRLKDLEAGDSLPGVTFHEPFGFFDYVNLQANSKCVLSDSGTVSEESSIVGFPAVTLRSAIERPEAMESGVLTLSDLDPARTLRCINFALQNWRRLEVPSEYRIMNFSHRVVSTILSTAESHKFWSGLR